MAWTSTGHSFRGSPVQPSCLDFLGARLHWVRNWHRRGLEVDRAHSSQGTNGALASGVETSWSRAR